MKSNSLFALIHSLSTHEKGYFRKFSRIYSAGGEKNYLELFDYIDKMEAYDERTIKAHFRNTTWIGHLPVLKKYLFAQILKSLELYQRAGKKDEHSIFRQVDILIARGMYREASGLLKEGERIAEEAENYQALLSACDRRRTLVINLLPPSRHGEGFAEVYERQAQVIDTISSILHIKRTSDWLLDIYYRHRIIRDTDLMAEIDVFVRDNLLSVIDQNRSVTYRHIAISAAILYYSVKREHHKLYDYARRHMELIESHESYFAGRYMHTLSIYFNYLSSCIGVGAFDEFDTKIKVLENAVTANGAPGRAYKFKLLFDLYFTYINVKKSYALLFQYLKRFEKEFKQYGALLASSDQFNLACKLANLLFVNMQIEEALDWTSFCQQLDSEEINEYTRVQIRMLDMMLYYEQGSYRLLDSKLLNTRRYLSNKRILYQAEQAIIKYLRQLIKAATAAQKATIFKKFHREVADIHAAHPTEQTLIDDLHLIQWTAGKAKEPMLLVNSF